MSKSNPVHLWRFGRTRALIFTQKSLNRAKTGVLHGGCPSRTVGLPARPRGTPLTGWCVRLPTLPLYPSPCLSGALALVVLPGILISTRSLLPTRPGGAFWSARVRVLVSVRPSTLRLFCFASGVFYFVWAFGIFSLVLASWLARGVGGFVLQRLV